MAIPDNLQTFMEVKIMGKLTPLGGDDQDTVTDLYYFRTTQGAPISASAFVTAFHTAIKSAWLASASELWEWQKTIVRIMSDPTIQAFESVVNETGGIAGDSLPSYIAPVIAKKTALRGRAYQGRLFFPCVPKTGTVANELAAGQITLFSTLRTAMLANVTDGGGNVWTPHLLVKSQSKITAKFNPAVIKSYQITSMPIRTVLGQQDQRRSKVA